MNPQATSLLLTAALVGGGLGAYHLLVHDKPAAIPLDEAPATALGSREWTALEARVDRLEAARPVAAGGGAGDVGALADLERRVAALEKRGASPAAALATGAWSEADLDSLRSMMDEVRRREQTETQRKQTETKLERAGLNLGPLDREKAIDRLLVFLEEVRPVAMEIARARDVEQRKALNAKRDEMVARLKADLDAAFPGQGQKIVEAVIAPPAVPGVTHR